MREQTRSTRQKEEENEEEEEIERVIFFRPPFFFTLSLSLGVVVIDDAGDLFFHWFLSVFFSRDDRARRSHSNTAAGSCSRSRVDAAS